MEVKQSIKEFYNQQAEKFSNTRKKHWPEFDYIANEIEEVLQKKDKVKILELGCGDGRFFRFLKEKFGDQIEYLWVDISEKLIEIAQKQGGNFVVSDMLEFLEKQDYQTYDVVVAIASFQHIPTKWERLLILKHIYRVLTYGWKLVMVNWSFSSWFFKKYKFQILKSFVIWILSLWGKPINDFYIPWKDKWKVFYRYYHIFFIFELKKLLKLAWFVIKEICYIWKDGQKTINWANSRNSFVVWEKEVVYKGGN